MKTQTTRWLLFAALMMLAACGDGSEPTAARADPTATPESTPTVTEPTQEPQPTATAAPAPTPQPTATPEPTATATPAPTVVPPTATPGFTPKPQPTATPEPTATATPVRAVPASTAAPLAIPAATATTVPPPATGFFSGSPPAATCENGSAIQLEGWCYLLFGNPELIDYGTCDHRGICTAQYRSECPEQAPKLIDNLCYARLERPVVPPALLPFEDCARARAYGRGGGVILRGASDYAPHLDTDSDGIACE